MPKNTPLPGKQYDEATHQWIETAEPSGDSHDAPDAASPAAPEINPATPESKE